MKPSRQFFTVIISFFIALIIPSISFGAQLPLKAPWMGSKVISQGNFGPVSHNTCYNRTLDPSNCDWENTYAIDISLSVGTEILAPADGTVSYVDPDPSGLGGIELAIEHTTPQGDKFSTVYMHLNEIIKQSGSVKQGELIAKSGASSAGSMSGTSPHLHFHIWSGSGSRDSHTKPFEHLILKQIGVDNDFEVYGSEGKSLNHSQIAGQTFASNNVKINSLAQIDGQSQIYWLQNGRAYSITSNDIINIMSSASVPGWGTDKIYTYSSGVLKIRAQGATPTDGDFLRGQSFITSTDHSSDGLLVRVYGGTDVYLLENGQKRKFFSTAVFTQHGYDLNSVIDVASSLLDSFTDGQTIYAPTRSGVIDFEEFRAKSLGGLGTQIGPNYINYSNYYADKGVFFASNFAITFCSIIENSAAIYNNNYSPHSGDACMYAPPVGGRPIRISFTTPVTRVGGYYTYGVYSSNQNGLTIDAVDSDGNIVQTKQSSYGANSPGTGNPLYEYIEVTYSKGIQYIDITSNYFTLDDLTIKNVLTDITASLPSGGVCLLQDMDTINQGQSKFKTVINAISQPLKIILNWGGSTFLIKVYKPDGTFYNQYQSSTPPISIDIPAADAQIGDWKFEIVPVEIPYDNYPFALVVGDFTDTDHDGIPDSIDNCPNKYNPLQLDANGNGIGDVCDPTPGCGGCGQAACEQFVDTDGDGIPDAIDNCPTVYNPNQLDANKNGIGDCCDPSPGCGGCGQVACDAVCVHP